MAQQPFLDRPTFNRHSSPGIDQVKRAGCRLAAVCEDLGDVALSEEYQDIFSGELLPPPAIVTVTVHQEHLSLGSCLGGDKARWATHRKGVLSMKLVIDVITSRFR